MHDLLTEVNEQLTQLEVDLDATHYLIEEFYEDLREEPKLLNQLQGFESFRSIESLLASLYANDYFEDKE